MCQINNKVSIYTIYNSTFYFPVWSLLTSSISPYGISDIWYDKTETCSVQYSTSTSRVNTCSTKRYQLVHKNINLCAAFCKLDIVLVGVMSNYDTQKGKSPKIPCTFVHSSLHIPWRKNRDKSLDVQPNELKTNKICWNQHFKMIFAYLLRHKCMLRAPV